MDKDQKKVKSKALVKPKSSSVKASGFIRVKGNVDRPFLIIVILLLCFGSVMVFSASFADAKTNEGDSYFYIKKQITWACIGLVAMLFAMVIDYRLIKKFTPLIFGVSFVLLALVPIVGVSEGVATRWLKIGPITIQPSEIMKLSIVLILALYMTHFSPQIIDYKKFWRSSLFGLFIPMFILAVVCVAVILEHHMSGTIIIFLIGIVVIFVGGARKIWLFIFISGATVIATFLIIFEPYTKARIDIWLHPEKDPLGDGWQTLQGLYAIGSGGFLGVGLGNSRQKHLYVSKPQNDFIFSIICEELGFVGALAIIALFTIFIWRGFVIAMKAPDAFSSLVVIGIVSKVAIQAVLNIAVVTNTIPNTGISLPFFSYGGSSLIILLAEMGIVLSISRYSYQER